MLFFHFDGRDVRSIVTPSYALSDLIFVPAGVLAAVLYNIGGIAVFWLFAGLMLLFVLSFNSIGMQRDPVPAERGPLTRLFEARLALTGRAPRRRCSPNASWPRRARCSASMSCISCSSIASGGMLDFRVHERQQVRLPVRQKPLETGLFGWLIARAEPLLVKDWRHAPPELLQRAEDGEWYRFVARHAAGQRWHRARPVVRAALGGWHLLHRRSASHAPARQGRSRARSPTRARSRTWRAIAGISRSASPNARPNSKRRTPRRSA